MSTITFSGRGEGAKLGPRASGMVVSASPADLYTFLVITGVIKPKASQS